MAGPPPQWPFAGVAPPGVAASGAQWFSGFAGEAGTPQNPAGPFAGEGARGRGGRLLRRRRGAQRPRPVRQRGGVRRGRFRARSARGEGAQAVHHHETARALDG